MRSAMLAASREGAIYAKGLAERSGFGFVNRTGRLNASVRIKRARDEQGRFVAGYVLESEGVDYAVHVEYKPRVHDRRRGPPYWLGRLALEPYAKQIADVTARVAGREVERLLRR